MNKYPLTKKCVVCVKEFKVHNGAEFRKIACTKLCGDKHAAKVRSGANHWNWKNPKALKPFLGKHHSQEATEKNRKAHLGKPSWNKGKTDIYSEQTKAIMSSKKIGSVPWNKETMGIMPIPWNKGKKLPQFSGVNNHSWKGGITPIHNKIRGSVEYKLWERSVKERDKHLCQKCGEKRVKYLMAHHILNFSSHVELRTAIDNGITFCRPCHKLFHKIYTVRNNSRKQLLEFLNN